MREYDSYKDSGVEWIGEIPMEWKTSQFKFYIHLRHGYQFREYDFTDSGIKIVKITQLHKDGFLDISNCSTIDENRLENFNNILIKKDDILMCLTGGTIGKIIRVGDVNEPLLQNYRVGHFSSLNYKTISNNYLFYLMSSEVIVGQIFYDVKETGQPNIGLEDMNRMKVCIPSIQEQQQIVSFLDTKTSLTDSLIEKTQKKIQLLKEKRTSLINHTVTKGLNPNMEMKDSGVEWIGEIPNHWSVKNLKYISEILPSNVDKHIYPDEVQVRLCNYTDVYYNDYITVDTPLKKGSCNENEFNKFSLEKGNVIITKDSETPDDIGVPTFVKDDLDNVVCGYHLTMIKPLTTNGGFIFRFIQSDRTRRYFEVNSNGITRYGLGKSSIENLILPIPPLSEQQQIVEYLDEQTDIIDTTITKEQKRIKFLKEYRQSLISEVVTGKIKVTNE